MDVLSSYQMAADSALTLSQTCAFLMIAPLLILAAVSGTGAADRLPYIARDVSRSVRHLAAKLRRGVVDSIVYAGQRVILAVDRIVDVPSLTDTAHNRLAQKYYRRGDHRETIAHAIASTRLVSYPTVDEWLDSILATDWRAIGEYSPLIVLLVAVSLGCGYEMQALTGAATLVGVSLSGRRTSAGCSDIEKEARRIAADLASHDYDRPDVSVASDRVAAGYRVLGSDDPSVVCEVREESRIDADPSTLASARIIREGGEYLVTT